MRSLVLRARARRALSALLRALPQRPFDALRHRHAAVDAADPVPAWLTRTLNVVRHRGIPASSPSFALPDLPGVRLVRADSFIAERAYWFGGRHGYEAAEIAWWIRFVEQAQHVLEVGANIGYYVVRTGGALERRPPHTLVEAHPGSADVLRRNLAENGIDDVRVVEAAAVPDGDVDEIELHLPITRDHYADAPTSPFVMSDAGAPDIGTGGAYAFRTIRVPAVRLTDLVVATTDLIKLDVEGFEHALLVSLEDHVRRARPTLFVEVLDGSTELVGWIETFLRPLGYRAFLPTVDALVEIDDVAALGSSAERGESRDVVLTCVDVTGWVPHGGAASAR